MTVIHNVDSTEEHTINVLSFCSGYAGIERGLDLAGVKHRVLAYVEIEAFAIANLVAKMEDGTLESAPIYTNLKTFPAHLFRDCVDLITGGYPCQPFSSAGKRLGDEDPRHLWPYIADAIDDVRPGRVFFENVDGHISMGLREVLSALEGRGYRQTWGVFSAAEVGAPHQRKRVFIMADAGCSSSAEGEQPSEPRPARTSEPSAGARGGMHEGANEEGSRWAARPGQEQYSWEEPRTIRRTQPGMGGAPDGSANRVDRLRLLGNGVVPQTVAKAWTTLTEQFI